MISQMSPREKTLAFLVGGAVALLLNVFLVKFFLDNYGKHKQAREEATRALEKFQRLETERDKWAKRDAWLTMHLVPMGDRDVADKKHREHVQEIAKKNQVLIEKADACNKSQQGAYVSLNSRMECKGTWEQIGFFLGDLQKPEDMIVIESLDLKVDPADKEKLRAVMVVAKWYGSD
jgi:hypothetical protein